MTAQVGWIGGKEKYVGEIVPVFQSAEARDKHEVKGQMLFVITWGNLILRWYIIADMMTFIDHMIF